MKPVVMAKLQPRIMCNMTTPETPKCLHTTLNFSEILPNGETLTHTITLHHYNPTTIVAIGVKTQYTPKPYILFGETITPPTITQYGYKP
jgi:hypothetical protein